MSIRTVWGGRGNGPRKRPRTRLPRSKKKKPSCFLAGLAGALGALGARGAKKAAPPAGALGPCQRCFLAAAKPAPIPRSCSRARRSPGPGGRRGRARRAPLRQLEIARSGCWQGRDADFFFVSAVVTNLFVAKFAGTYAATTGLTRSAAPAQHGATGSLQKRICRCRIARTV